MKTNEMSHAVFTELYELGLFSYDLRELWMKTPGNRNPLNEAKTHKNYMVALIIFKSVLIVALISLFLTKIGLQSAEQLARANAGIDTAGLVLIVILAIAETAFWCELSGQKSSFGTAVIELCEALGKTFREVNGATREELMVWGDEAFHYLRNDYKPELRSARPNPILDDEIAEKIRELRILLQKFNLLLQYTDETITIG